MTTTVVATVAQKFTVTGMTCSHCERAVTAELLQARRRHPRRRRRRRRHRDHRKRRHPARRRRRGRRRRGRIRAGPMNTTTRLAAFGVALVAIVGVGAGLGAAIGPDVTQPAAEAPAPIGQGVVADRRRLPPGPRLHHLDRDGGTFRFTIEDQHDRAVHDFTPLHERDLHLIVVNRELTTFHHVHPTLDADGTWSIDLPAARPRAPTGPSPTSRSPTDPASPSAPT